MKIGIVSNLYPPDERGGAELVASRIADELYRRGHQIFVVSTEQFSGWSSLKPHVVDERLGKVYRFFPPNLYHLTNGSKHSILTRIIWHVIDTVSQSSSKMLKRVLVNEEPDVMITHNLKGIGLGVARGIQEMGIRHIHTLHDIQLSIPSGLMIYKHEHNFVNRSVFRKWYESFVKKAIGTPDVVLSPSKFLLEFYQDRGFFTDSTTKIIPNPAPNSYRVLRVERPEGPVRFLFVGQIEPHKGIEFLHNTLQYLPFDCELHIAGDGSLRPDVEAWAARDKRVFYHGFISLGHILQLMSNCDAVVLPSLCYENSPTVIYEAFHVGVPVVASDIGGIGELIDHGKTGLLFEPGNQDALTAALTDVEQKRSWFWDQTPKLRERAEKYAIEKYVDELEKMF